MARPSGSNLLRNDGGVFVRVTAVGPAGALVDADHDGRPDLFAGTAMLTNVASVVALPLLAGQADYSLLVPPSPVLVGVELVGQGLVFDTERIMLTNAVFDTVL